MQNFEVYGLPLKLHTAESKVEALEFLGSRPQMQWALAIALIDVVMESDPAGLELCQHIRGEMDNKLTQLFIRTGQPGVAPERTVIDRYDISGYFTKAETTEDKLYSLVKSGVRQFHTSSLLEGALALLQHLVNVGDSKEQLKATFAHVVQSTQPADAPADNATYVAIDGQTVWGPIGWDEPTALALKEKLDASEGTPFSPDGDKFVLGEENGYHTMLLKVAAQPPRPEVFIVQKYREPFAQPDDHRTITSYNVFKTAATLWARAE